MKNYPTHTLFCVTKDTPEAKAEWKPVGVAFTNKGGILSIRFDEGKSAADIPAGGDLVLAMRQYRRTDSNQGGQQ